MLICIGMLGPAPSRAALDGEGDRIRARYGVDLVGRSQAVFALPKGPTTVRSFRWTPEEDAPDGAWRSARIRLVWDGDDPEEAGVDLPLGRLVTPGEGEESHYVNMRAMPYRKSARLVIDAGGEVRGMVEIVTGPGTAEDRERGYLRAGVVSEGSESGSDDPGEIGENRGDGSPPGVRYWYDRRPGPSSDD